MTPDKEGKPMLKRILSVLLCAASSNCESVTGQLCARRPEGMTRAVSRSASA